MTRAPSPTGLPLARPAGPAPEARRPVFLPREHGSWSVTLEPLAAGLLIAPTVAGGGLALATVAAFLARRPLKAVFGQGAIRRPAALGAAALLALLSIGGLAAAAVLGGAPPLWPLVPSGILGAWFLILDGRGSGRSAGAEVLAGASLALLPAAFATLAGWPPSAALALAAVMVARTVPTLLLVRQAVRAGKNQPSRRAIPIAAAAVACPALAGLAALSLVPWTTVVLALALLARSLVLTTPREQKYSARRLGTIEAGLGVLYVAAAALGYLAWRPNP